LTILALKTYKNGDYEQKWLKTSGILLGN